MRLFATELLSPPRTASKLRRSARCCRATGPLAPTSRRGHCILRRQLWQAKGDKPLEGAGPAPASAVVTARSPSKDVHPWAVAISVRGGMHPAAVQPRGLAEAKLTPAMEIQNPEG